MNRSHGRRIRPQQSIILIAITAEYKIQFHNQRSNMLATVKVQNADAVLIMDGGHFTDKQMVVS
jgi:protein-tyrosine-phosphatase